MVQFAVPTNQFGLVINVVENDNNVKQLSDKPCRRCKRHNDAGFGQFFNILEQVCFKRGVYFQKVDARKTSQICPNCLHETGQKTLAERVHKCDNCGYQTDRDVAAAQVVLIRGLAAVGHTVKMLSEGKFVGIPVN